MDVLGRIEISKMDALKGVDYAMQDIQKNTGLIDEGIEIINERYTKMNQYDAQIRNLFDKLFSAENSRTDELVKYFDNLEQLLKDTFSGLMSVVDGFTDFGNNFNNMALKTEEKIGDLNSVIESIDSVISNCKKTEITVNARRKLLLGKMGLKKWTLRFDGIDDIVNQFTVHTHRKQARSISGIEEKNGTKEAGSINIF